jgi:hypothetical protein
MGKKGSNNIASLLMQDLHDKFWLRRGCPGKKLTIAMENCGGQKNKNVVLRLTPYLAEMGYFLTVEYMFYIRGHTNNTCDRMFNQMKLKFHRRDIFSWGQALETLNIKEHVNIVDAQESHFKDYGALLDKFYVNFKQNTIQKNHIFKEESIDEALAMQCAIHDGAVFVKKPMLKKVQVLRAKSNDAIVKLLPLPQPPVRARTDARTNPSAQRATQLRSVLARVYDVSRQNQITTTVP